MASGKAHELDTDVLKLHTKVSGSTEGGACLQKHGEKRGETSCSHQWQARMRAENEDFHVYAYPAYKRLLRHPKRVEVGDGDNLVRFVEEMDTKFRVTRSARASRTQGRPMLLSDEQRQTHGRGKKDLRGNWDPKYGKNFTKANIPYRHNAHHLVPDSSLNDALLEATRGGESYLWLIIRRDLLKAKYNVHHKNNMIILPMEEEVARGLGLPRHLCGDATKKRIEDDPDSVDGQYYTGMDHPNYSKRVTELLKKVMDDYRDAIDVDESGHPDFPDGEDIKKKVENISDKIRKKIINWGKKKASGRPVDMMWKKQETGEDGTVLNPINIDAL